MEPHHLDPWVLAGDATTPDAYELRCQRQNDYEGRLYFGRRRRKGKDDGEVRERPAPYGARSFSAELVPEQTTTGQRPDHVCGGRSIRPANGIAPRPAP